MRRHFFAIRHKPSGGFLPAMQSYGFTRCEPSLKEPPRLFTSSNSVNQALTRWLAGEHYEGFENDDERTIRIVRRADRQRKDMEIVEIETVVRTLTEAQLRSL